MTPQAIKAETQHTGITCLAQLEEVLELAGKCVVPLLQPGQPGQWVVQKYVEWLLTILGTKFHLWQWFLVSDWNPHWFYRDSYMSFCSRPFSMHCLHRSRHLCNVIIQNWWRLARGRHPKLPCDLIWSSQQFQLYLQQAGHAEAREKLILFELYGADFIFGEDCQPLLEINTNPPLEPAQR
ncbi:LOW QUALITY PROTEIN: tubulin monoglycylase TTLL3-like [Ara ararauna]